MLAKSKDFITIAARFIREQPGVLYAISLWYVALSWTASYHFETHPRWLDVSVASIVLTAVFSIRMLWRALMPQRTLVALSISAMLVNLAFLAQQQPQGYTYDVDAHVQTINYIRHHFWLPDISMGGEAHQPPLYYIVSGLLAWFISLFDRLGEHNARVSLACMNFMLFQLFVLYGLRLIREVTRQPLLVWIGAIAWLFWPAHMLHSFRISNDILLYLSFMGCIVHFRLWLSQQDITQLKRSLLWMAVAFATKNSALLLPIILAAWWCIRRRKPEVQLRLLVVPLLLVTIAAGMGIGRNAVYSLSGGNASVFEGKYGAPSNFVTKPALIELDVQGLLAVPYAYHPLGKDYLFWNLYLRSMNFGEYQWRGLLAAHGLNLSLLLMWGVAVGLGGFLVYKREASAQTKQFALLTGACVLATALMRMYADGFAAWADTRHLYPAVCFFVAAYLSILEDIRARSNTWYEIGAVLLVIHSVLALGHLYMQLTAGHRLPILAGT